MREQQALIAANQVLRRDHGDNSHILVLVVIAIFVCVSFFWAK